MKEQAIDARGSVVRRVVYCAIVSRLLLVILIIFWRTLFNPYDLSAALNPSCISDSSIHDTSSSEAVPWRSVASAIEGFIVWDDVYFVRIAQCGYEYEQSYAFLPLLPISIRILSLTVFAPLIPYIGQRAVLAISGYILNNILFVFAAFFFYKGVGFLGYFRIHQIPNFLLASPMLFLASCSIAYYIKSRPEIFSLCFPLSSEQNIVAPPSLSSDNSGSCLVPNNSLSRNRKQVKNKEDQNVLNSGNKISLRPRYFSFLVLPFILHLGFMTVTAFFVMHVQVATRFLSASPPIYWFASHLMSLGHHKLCGYIIWTYCIAYILIGSLLFSNFYPFT